MMLGEKITDTFSSISFGMPKEISVKSKSKSERISNETV